MIQEYKKRSCIGQFFAAVKDGTKLILYLTVILSVSYFFYYMFHDFVMSILLKNTAKETRICGTGRHECLAPFRKQSPLIYVSPQHKLATFAIHKNIGNMTKGTMCYLFDQQLSTSDFPTFEDYAGSLECWENATNFYSDFDSLLFDYPDFNQDPEWKLFILTRDPIERLINGYVDKCHRNPPELPQCGSDFSEFISNLHKHLLKASDGIEPIPTDIFIQNFSPQTWQCDFQRTFRKLIPIKYSSEPGKEARFFEDFTNLLKSAKVSKADLDYITNQFTTKNSKESKINTSEMVHSVTAELMGNQKLLKKVIQVYFYDFVLLGYHFPIEY